MTEWIDGGRELYCLYQQGHIKVSISGALVSIYILDDDEFEYQPVKRTRILNKDTEQLKQDALHWAASVLQSWSDAIKEEMNNDE